LDQAGTDRINVIKGNKLPVPDEGGLLKSAFLKTYKRIKVIVDWYMPYTISPVLHGALFYLYFFGMK
jgi:hypothetical protein